LFDGHCCLGTNIAPAYDSSKLISFNNKWNKALNERKFNQNQNQETDIDINNKLNNQKEDEVMAEMFKKVCELSFDDIRALIYGQLKGVLSENEYDYSWISDVYETYFILSYWNDDTHKYYKVSYTKVEEVITIDWENRNEVYLYQEWREIPEVQQVLNSITEKDDTIKTLNSTIETLTTEKEGLTVKFNEATDSITELSKQVNEMKPIVETYNNAQTEKALNDQKVKFEEKFVALNAKAKFDTDEVQDLIKKSINNTEEGKAAILSLNSILVDLVKPVKETKEVKEFNSREMKNLIDTKDSFESRYFV
jgi:uncharacterized coiled-coil DUF342 family protein